MTIPVTYSRGLGNYSFSAAEIATLRPMALLDGKVKSLVNAMAAFSPTAADHTTRPVAHQTAPARGWWLSGDNTLGRRPCKHS